MSSIEINEELLDQKLAHLEEARSWSSRVISKLETMIRTADDYTLFRVNPLQYAKEKLMAETEAVELFLYASKAGLFEMGVDDVGDEYPVRFNGALVPESGIFLRTATFGVRPVVTLKVLFRRPRMLVVLTR